MKILVAADLHGAAASTEQLLEAWVREGAERLLLLGDLLAHGAASERSQDTTAELLNSLKDQIVCVRGNNDWESDLLRLEFGWRDYQLLRVAGYTIFTTHGHIYNEHRLPPIPFDVLLHGHTHVPCCRPHDGYVQMNPGAVSRPRNGSVNGYLLINERDFYWKDLQGNQLNHYHWQPADSK